MYEVKKPLKWTVKYIGRFLYIHKIVYTEILNIYSPMMPTYYYYLLYILFDNFIK